jgi:hypothetical protein
MSNRELVVASKGNADRPIIVFQGLSDEQFKQAITLFQPKPETRATLMTNPVVTQDLTEAIAHLESRMYVSRDTKVFNDQMISNNFDNTLLSMMGPDAEVFRINEWFDGARRAHIPKAVLEYDPNPKNGDFTAMPTHKGITVDWVTLLTDMELRYPGFIALLANCIRIEKDIQDKISKKTQERQVEWDMPQRMPAPIDHGTPMFSLSAGSFLGGKF